MNLRRHVRVLLWTFAGIARMSAADVNAPAVAVRPDFRFGVGDVLQIMVWKEPDASVPSLVVRSDGKISLPLIKEVEVMGMTPSGLEEALNQRFAAFLNDPEVTVVVKEVHSRRIQVLGAVKREGVIELQQGMTVLEAIGVAGGLTEFAKRKKIYVLREENGKAVRLPFDYDAVIRGLRVEQNVSLKPGDTVVVPL